MRAAHPSHGSIRIRAEANRIGKEEERRKWQCQKEVPYGSRI